MFWIIMGKLRCQSFDDDAHVCLRFTPGNPGFQPRDQTPETIELAASRNFGSFVAYRYPQVGTAPRKAGSHDANQRVLHPTQFEGLPDERSIGVEFRDPGAVAHHKNRRNSRPVIRILQRTAKKRRDAEYIQAAGRNVIAPKTNTVVAIHVYDVVLEICGYTFKNVILLSDFLNFGDGK
jgi:hypothetical protein